MTSRSGTLVYFILEILSLCVMLGSGESIRLLTDGRTNHMLWWSNPMLTSQFMLSSGKIQSLKRPELCTGICCYRFPIFLVTSKLETGSSAIINLIRILVHCGRAKIFYLPQPGIEPRSLDLQVNTLPRRCKSRLLPQGSRSVLYIPRPCYIHPLQFEIRPRISWYRNHVKMNPKEIFMHRDVLIYPYLTFVHQCNASVHSPLKRCVEWVFCIHVPHMLNIFSYI